MKKIFTLLIVFFVAAIFWFYGNYSTALRYSLNSEGTGRVVVNIETGSSAHQVAKLLKSKGLIKSPYFFKLILDQREQADEIKAGRLVFQESYNLHQVIDALIEGRSEEIPATILEGWTIQEIAVYMEKLGITTEEAFMDCIRSCSFDFDYLPEGSLEGYLYPDTYFVDLAVFSNQRFIGRLIRTFGDKLTDADYANIEASGHNLEQIVKMASIVEREERNSAERATVAGILWKRFDNGVGLGADATVLYALGRTKGGLTYEDLQVDSLYNTRKYRGLPPTPISNPSINSIRAAISPKKTPYWYYLHDSDGDVHYAETLEGHNANKAKYL